MPLGTQIASAFVAITGDNTGLKNVLTDSKKLVQGFVNNLFQGIGQGIGQAIFNQIGRGINAGIGLIKNSLSATSDLNEALSKTVVAFGDSASEILAWSKTSATALGQSRFQALEAAASFGLLFSSMNLAEEESARMSRGLVELATDMASINNIPIDEALIKLRAGLVGETEPLRTVGVLLNAAAVEQEALNSALAESKDAITEQDKVLARYNLILKQTTKTQGDFQRTIEGIANQERILQAQRADAIAQIGQAFAPIYLVILRNINRLLGEVTPYGENIIRSLAEGMVKGIIYILPALRFVKDAITYWLKPGSPPNLLPDLDKWGTAAMQVYLDSWAAADFGVLQTLGQTIEGIVRSFVTSGAIAESDVIDRVFGTRQAIASAVAQWRTAGRVTVEALQAIEDAAGPAGFHLAGLVRAYFDLENASRAAAQAQKELTDTTEQYDRLLRPLNDQLDEINDKEQEIRDRQARSAARRVIRDPRSTANEKRLAELELERIAVSQSIEGVQEERDAAVRAAEDKLKAAQKQVEVARAVSDAQQALLEQTMINNRLLGEQNDLLEKQAEDAERVRQAALAYNLAISDTEGKLALLRSELGRYQLGSVDYYNTLTQIAGLEKQLKDERGEESLFPAESILPSLDELGVPQWANDLAEMLDKEIRKALGLRDQDIIPALMDVPREGEVPTLASLAREGAPEPEVSERVKDFVEQIENLTGAIQGLVGPLEFIATLFGFNAAESAKAASETEEATDDIALAIQNTAGLIENAGNLDWKAAFVNLREIVATGLVGIASLLPTPDGGEPTDSNSPVHGLKLMGAAFFGLLQGGMLLGQGPLILQYLSFLQWLRDQLPGSEPADTSSPLYGLGDAGEAILDMVWDGLKLKWEEVSKWWTDKMQWLRDMLPFSEPKNPASPLTGLKESGKAIIEQIQLGVDSIELTLPTPNMGLMAQGVNAGPSSSKTVIFQKGAFEFVGSNASDVPAMEDRLKTFLEEYLDA